MADKNNSVQMPLTIHAQYIKDFSFENPNAPATLRPGADKGNPKMEVNVNMNAEPLDDKGHYEVILSVQAMATRGDSRLFLAELHYGVVCSIAKGVPEQHAHPLLLIEVPKLAFPFARQILCDAVLGGGYPPLMLNPVDFEALYRNQYEKEKAEAAKAGQA